MGLLDDSDLSGVDLFADTLPHIDSKSARDLVTEVISGVPLPDDFEPNSNLTATNFDDAAEIDRHDGSGIARDTSRADGGHGNVDNIHSDNLGTPSAAGKSLVELIVEESVS